MIKKKAKGKRSLEKSINNIKKGDNQRNNSEESQKRKKEAFL